MSEPPNTRHMKLILDDLDFDTIQAEITHRQVRSRRAGDSETCLPEGDSNLAGAILAECIRDLNEYRAMWEAQRGED